MTTIGHAQHHRQGIPGIPRIAAAGADRRNEKQRPAFLLFVFLCKISDATDGRWYGRTDHRWYGTVPDG